jgi:hypothetical protein
VYKRQGVLNLEEVMGSGTSALREAASSLSALPRLETPLLGIGQDIEAYRQVPGSLGDISENLAEIRTAMRRLLENSVQRGSLPGSPEVQPRPTVRQETTDRPFPGSDER